MCDNAGVKSSLLSAVIALFLSLLGVQQAASIPSHTNPSPVTVAHSRTSASFAAAAAATGAVAGVVGIEGGVVSEEFNLESSGVDAPDRRPRHDQQYHED